MNIIRTKKFVLFGLLLSLGFAHDALSCEKKGVGFVPVAGMKAAEQFKLLNAHWYYDWTMTPVKDSGGVAFVPMVSGRSLSLSRDLSALSNLSNAPALLAYNEPDLTEQANMTVDDAVALWPQLQSHAVRIGGPAVSTMHGLTWLGTFMSQVREKRLKIDFVAAHYYGPPDADAFLEYIDRLHDNYNRPIWITEFAVKENGRDPNHEHYTADEVLNFMHIIIPELERRSYVERFAWWGVGGAKSDLLKSSRFFNDDGSLTDVGRYYASVEANDNGPLCGLP